MKFGARTKLPEEKYYEKDNSLLLFQETSRTLQTYFETP